MVNYFLLLYRNLAALYKLLEYRPCRLTTCAVGHMLGMPVNSLLECRILRHAMCFVPFGVEFWWGDITFLRHR